MRWVAPEPDTARAAPTDQAMLGVDDGQPRFRIVKERDPDMIVKFRVIECHDLAFLIGG
jgi:hypothetical protein